MFDPALLKDQISFVEARLRARGLDPSAELSAEELNQLHDLIQQARKKGK